MYQKFLLPFPMLVVLFQVSCGPTQLSIHASNTVGPVYGHESDTVYGVGMLGQPRSFTRGGITSARDVQIEWEDSAKEGGERLIRSSATEFLVEPDVGKPFLFVQYNEEQLKAGERVLLLKENGCWARVTALFYLVWAKRLFSKTLARFLSCVFHSFVVVTVFVQKLVNRPGLPAIWR